MNKYELVDMIETGFDTLKTTEIIASETIIVAIIEKLAEYESLCGQDEFLEKTSERVFQHREKIKAEKKKRERQ